MKPRPDPATKPYYGCLICPNFRNTCGGKPTRDMTLPEWGEYICNVMYFFHLSNAYVAKEADVSIKTMEKISARNFDQDIMSGTKRRIEQVVLGSVGDFTCYLRHNNTDDQIVALQAEIESLKEKVDFLRKENDRKAKIIDMYLAK